jgi:hypothetical protein
MSKRGHQPGVVSVAGDVLRTPGQHDPGMEDIRPSKLHVRA